MGYVTSELLLRIAECLLLPRYGVGDSGSTTTLVDAQLDEPDGLFNGGTIWFIGGVTLDKKSAVITTWNATTHTFTYPTQSAVPSVDQQYAVLDARYPRDQLAGALNVALQELGPFDQKNETLTIVSGQDKYTLPAGVSQVKRVEFATESADPLTWSPPYHWWGEWNGVLQLSPHHLPPPGWTGNKIRLTYEAGHARVFNDSDVITDAVHPQRIAWHAAWIAAMHRNRRGDTADQVTKDAEEKARAMALQLEREHPIRRISRDENWSNLP